MSRGEYARKLGKRLTEKQKHKKYIPKYLKPKLIIQEAQFRYRCPICWDKHFYRENGQGCLDKCWGTLLDMIWKILEQEKKEPKEIGSWQWDLDDFHGRYCGVTEYDDGSEKYFKSIDGFVFISLDELEEVLKRERPRLWQQGTRELPKQIRRFKLEQS